MSSHRYNAVYNPAYCLTLRRDRLTVMSQEAVKAALAQMSAKNRLLIMSSAYDVWETELALKTKIIGKRTGFGIEVIEHVTDSYDEARQLIQILKKHEDHLDDLIVVAEKEHVARAARAIRKEIEKAGFDIVVREKSFRASKLERTYEPHPVKILGWIKSVRGGNRFLWSAWNRLFSLIS